MLQSKCQHVTPSFLDLLGKRTEEKEGATVVADP